MSCPSSQQPEQTTAAACQARDPTPCKFDCLFDTGAANAKRLRACGNHLQRQRCRQLIAERPCQWDGPSQNQLERGRDRAINYVQAQGFNREAKTWGDRSKATHRHAFRSRLAWHAHRHVTAALRGTPDFATLPHGTTATGTRDLCTIALVTLPSHISFSLPLLQQQGVVNSSSLLTLSYRPAAHTSYTNTASAHLCRAITTHSADRSSALLQMSAATLSVSVGPTITCRLKATLAATSFFANRCVTNSLVSSTCGSARKRRREAHTGPRQLNPSSAPPAVQHSRRGVCMRPPTGGSSATTWTRP